MELIKGNTRSLDYISHGYAVLQTWGLLYIPGSIFVAGSHQGSLICRIPHADGVGLETMRPLLPHPRGFKDVCFRIWNARSEVRCLQLRCGYAELGPNCL